MGVGGRKNLQHKVLSVNLFRLDKYYFFQSIIFLSTWSAALRKIFLMAVFLIGTSVDANVDPQHHEMCKEAKDYVGCIRAMTTDLTQPGPADVRRIDQTNRPGLLSEMGNSCPAGYAYSGAGKCRSIKCIRGGIFGRNEPQLSGKGHSCAGVMRNFGILAGRASMVWGNEYINASNNPSCPNKEPSIGSRSSCGSSRLPGSSDKNWMNDLDVD